MATGGIEDDTDLYTCQICLEDQTKRTPRLLSCHHSFCQDCIKNPVKQGKVECPTCRKLTLIAEDDVAELSMNFMLMKMKEHMDKVIHRKQSLCQVCEINIADKKCRECSHLLCDPCIIKHESYEEFKDHLILPVCAEHQHGLIIHFCLECVKGVCPLCLLKDHQSHKKEIVSYREGIQVIKERLLTLKAFLHKKILLFSQSEKNEELRHSQLLEKDIETLCEKYEEKYKELLKMLGQIESHNQNIKSILDDKSVAESLAEQLDRCLLETDIKILKSYSELKEKVDAIIDTDERTFVCHHFDLDVSYLQCHYLEYNRNTTTNVSPLEDTTARKSCFTAKLIYEMNDLVLLSIVYPMRIQCIKSTKLTIFDTVSRRCAIINTGVSVDQPIIEKHLWEDARCDALYSHCDNCCWYTTEDTITVCVWPDGCEFFCYDTNLKNISKIFKGIHSKKIIFDNVLERI